MNKVSAKFTLVAIVAVILSQVFSGCIRRDLEIEYGGSMKVIVRCRWELTAYPETPTGMTIYLFREGDSAPKTFTTSRVDSCVLNLDAGRYRLYMISQSPEEYATLIFSDMDKFDKARATLEENVSSWYSRYRKTDSEPIAVNPECIAVGVSDEFEITEQMIEEYETFYRKYDHKRIYDPRDGMDGINEEERIEYRTIEIPVKPANIVSQLWVTVYADRADNLRYVRAATAGMARTIGLTSAATAHESSIQILDQWSLDLNTKVSRVGRLDGIITTLGLPDAEMPSPDRDPELNISTLLVDNSTTADFVFYVGDKIKLETSNTGYRNLYHIVLGSNEDPAIVIPEVDPVEEGGGFTAGVEDWGDEVDVDIPI